MTSRKATETITIVVGDCGITSKPSLKYLGVQIDARLRFDEHLEIAGVKAARVTSALARIMPNIGGPRQSRRKLLSSVVSSTILYAAPIWSQAMEVFSYSRQIRSTYRRASFRVAGAFRTVSYEAVYVITGMSSIELVVEERTKIYQRLREDQDVNRCDLAGEEHRETMER